MEPGSPAEFRIEAPSSEKGDPSGSSSRKNLRERLREERLPSLFSSMSPVTAATFVLSLRRRSLLVLSFCYNHIANHSGASRHRNVV